MTRNKKPVAFVFMVTPKYYEEKVTCKNLWALRNDGNYQFRIRAESLDEYLTSKGLVRQVHPNNPEYYVVGEVGATLSMGALIPIYSWDEERFPLPPIKLKKTK